MSKRRGQIFRPCVACGEIVNFVPWKEERHRGNIWHWANEDGSHHVCEMLEQKHMKSIREEKV